MVEGELNDLVMAIDPRSDKVERVDLGGSPHPIAISHGTGKRSRPRGLLRHAAGLRIDHRDDAFGLERSAPDGEMLFVWAPTRAWCTCDLHAHACINADAGD